MGFGFKNTAVLDVKTELEIVSVGYQRLTVNLVANGGNLLVKLPEISFSFAMNK